jgi:hypothetical protein
LLPDPNQPGAPTDGAPTPAGVEQELPINTQPKTDDSASARQSHVVGALSTIRTTSAEFQFGAAGGNAQTQSLVNDGRLRRLPVVVPIDTRITVAPTTGTGIFAAPPAAVPSATPIENNQIRAAENDAKLSIWR